MLSQKILKNFFLNEVLLNVACMCCFSCVEDCWDDYCVCCPDWDDIKELFETWRQDYVVLGTTVLSTCGDGCVRQKNAYIMLAMVLFFELCSFGLICLGLYDILHKPSFEFDTPHRWNEECPYGRDSLNSANSQSDLLLPIHATLLSLGAFFYCFTCKPPYGILIGAIR